MTITVDERNSAGHSEEYSPSIPSSHGTHSLSEDSQTDELLLCTPSPKSSGALSFCSDDEEFSHHRFYGPSKDAEGERILHGFRLVDVLGQNPRFRSEPAHIGALSSTLVSMENIDGNPFEVKFTEDKLGFGTELKAAENNQVRVHVAYVDAESPAKRAGVVIGDYLISVNGKRFEPDMTEDQLLNLIKTAENPRTMLFMRFGDKGDSPKQGNIARKSSGVLSRLRTAKKYVGSKIARKPSVEVHQDCSCDGCGVSPIKGPLWSCSVCIDFNLCDICYQHGVHGMEKSESMHLLNEAIAQEKIKRKCKTLTPEFLTSLRRDICKGRIDKFEYMGNWLADIIGGTAASKITVRGIEVPHLCPESRQRFVSMLMPLASNRNDIEVNIEWLPQPHSNATEDHYSSCDESTPEATGDKELLRIWISDKKTRTKSPFA